MVNQIKQECQILIDKYEKLYRIVFPSNERVAVLDYNSVKEVSKFIASCLLLTPDRILYEVFKILKKNPKYKDIEDIQIKSLPNWHKTNINEISKKDIFQFKTIRGLVMGIYDKSVVSAKTKFQCCNCKKVLEQKQKGSAIVMPDKKCCEKPDIIMISRKIEEIMIVDLCAVDEERKSINENVQIRCVFRNFILEENSKYIFPGALLEINGIIREKILEPNEKLSPYSVYYIDANDILTANKSFIPIKRVNRYNKQSVLEKNEKLNESKFSMDDLIVDNETLEKLKNIVAYHKNKDKIFNDWGFKKIIKNGKGTIVNFTGPSGTGKTLAAHAISSELGMDIIIVDYSELRNKYVGETEKNTKKIFNDAMKNNAVLFFDEADAIALSRDTLNASWEMSEVNTLLKEIENFEGVCIFATNYPQKYDTAFARRFTMQIEFKMPGKEECIKIFDKLLPLESREEGMELKELNLEGFSGGDLKNVVLNSAGIAIKRNSLKIQVNDIKNAIEISKKGKGINKSTIRNEYIG